MNEALPRSFFSRPSQAVAPDLLGKLLVRKIGKIKFVGKIVEVEAYLGEEDPAAHAAKGRTGRTEVLYGEPGRAYIFQIHTHNCLNIVTETDKPSCVLFRALEPVSKNFDNTNGPGKLCRALHITKELYGVDMTRSDSPLYIVDSNEQFEVVTSARIGISKAADWPLRFHVKDNPYVSR